MVRDAVVSCVLCLGLLGCSSSGDGHDGSDSGVCDAVTCSGHGTCDASTGRAACLCDDSYVTSGLSCVATTGPCAGVTCSGHGTCDDSSGDAACQCDADFEAQGTACVATTGPCAGVTCSDHGSCSVVGGEPRCACDPSYVTSGGTQCVPSTAPALGGCQLLPSDHLFNTPIDNLPVHPNSEGFLGMIGSTNVHLDLGLSTDTTSEEYWGIPYNIVHGDSLDWVPAHFGTTDPDMDWDPTSESDCAIAGTSSTKTLVSPCTASAAPTPLFPIPESVLVEGGIVTDPSQPYGDHHMLLLDADTCRLWELYHCYPNTSGGWDIFGAATFDLSSNALRPADWTSADAAGFPILPLLLRGEEAQSGEIHHALRFTIESNKIRNEYVWPARHLTTNGDDSADRPPMGQLFRLRADYPIPQDASTQAKAILTALKTYGMYLADGGSDLYIQGEPFAGWEDDLFSVVQSVSTEDFEAVDLSPIQSRAGFDPDSAAVPPP